jgi:ribosomal protein S18 acetylase RimI-like enzyme
MKLDTLAQLEQAIALYRKLGFRPIAPYGHHPYPGTVCFGRML